MESQLYVVTEIEEKGLGCVAMKKIKRGTLILREKPCLLQKINTTGNLDKDYFDNIFDAYEKMDSHQKKNFLELANNSEHIEERNVYHIGRKKVFLNYLKENPKSYQEGVALKVIQITETNRFHNGVYLEMSRFNHSCASNGEYFWNEDLNTRDVRAIRKIDEGEEITLNYIGLIDKTVHRDQRRRSLFESHNFACVCSACDLSDEQLQAQNRLSDEFIRLINKKKEVKSMNAAMNNSDTSDEVKCIKDLYKTAKDLKFFRRTSILNKIVEEGFDAACQGYLTMCEIEKKVNAAALPALVKAKKTVFWKDVCNFAKVGSEISATVHGPEHSEAIQWRKRKEDPVQYFKDDNQGDPHWNA